MSPYPQAGELWCYKRNPSLMVLVMRIAESNELVLTKNLFRNEPNEPLVEGWRGINTFRTTWRPVTQEIK